MHKRHSDCKGTVLAADLEELIARDPPQVHEVLGAGDGHFHNNCENHGFRGLEIQSLCYEKGMKTGQFVSEASKMTLRWLKGGLSIVWEKVI
jgi:hypothetical protein